MKSLFSLLIAIVSFGTSSFATEHPFVVNPLNSLTYSFPGAQEVKWSAVDTYQKATFTYQGRVYSAFFDQQGELIATTHAISINELPKSLKANLQEELKTYWISDLIVMSTKEGDSYYVQLEYAGSKLVKQSKGSKWVTY